MNAAQRAEDKKPTRSELWPEDVPTRAELVEAMREGYARLDTHGVADTMYVWLPMCRWVVNSVTRDCASMLAIGERAELDDVVALWFDDVLHVGRWLDPSRDPQMFGELERILGDFALRFSHEPTYRAIHVACTCADLLRSKGEAAASDAAYAMIQASFPDRAQVVSRWVDSRLDAAQTLDAGLLLQCEAQVVAALKDDHVDREEHHLGWLLQGLRADLEYARRFDGDADSRWPYFEVFNWPAPRALYRLDPHLEDAFAIRWGPWLAGR